MPPDIVYECPVCGQIFRANTYWRLDQVVAVHDAREHDLPA